MRLMQNLTQLSDLMLDWVDMSSVTLDSLRNVSSSLKSLSLAACSLVGNFPEDVFQLPNLEKLVLPSNGLNGSMPSMFNSSSPASTGISGNIPASIHNLNHLDLSFNNYVGSIPASIGNLSKLTHLDLSYNHLTGHIPSSLANLESLTDLDLSSNNLMGPIPDAFHNLTRVTTLDLSNSLLTGQIPPSIFDLKQLTRLTLWYTQVSGPLPHQINGLPVLTRLVLSNNLLSGTIPSWLFDLPSLAYLDLSQNKLSGEIPEFKSTTLGVIILSNNNLQGPIPVSLFDVELARKIDFSSNNFNGTLDLDLFSKLKRLLTLSLANNNLSVEVDGGGNFTWPMLQSLDLSSCNLKSFPYFLSTQSELGLLSLSQNKINGEVPDWLWLLANYSLYHLDISSNSLTSMGMPSVLNKLGHLSASILDLSNNRLSGIISQWLGSLSRLQVLNLRMNNFTGYLPPSFSTNCSLKDLDLSQNQLEGKLPQSLANCKKLEVLDIGDNKIVDRFPSWMDSLPNLQVLVLRSNRFYGPIGRPKSATPFPQLRILDLSDNRFAGRLPGRYLAKLKSMAFVKDIDVQNRNDLYMRETDYNYKIVLTVKGSQVEIAILVMFSTMDLSNNKFEGEIPQLVGRLKSLNGLNFSHNSLSGNIPLSLANMSMLESLDLSSNNLTGGIPDKLKILNFLALLNLSYNQLEGPIPQGDQFNTFGNDSYRGNVGLCGLPLTKTCGDDAPPPFGSTSDDYSWDWNWKIVGMGYGSGLVIGFSIAYMVFTVVEPLWFAKMIDRLLLPYYTRATTRNRRRKERRR